MKYVHIQCLVRHGSTSCQICRVHLFTYPKMLRLKWMQHTEGFSTRMQCIEVAMMSFLPTLIFFLLAWAFDSPGFARLFNWCVIVGLISVIVAIVADIPPLERWVVVPALSVAFWLFCSAWDLTCAGLKALKPAVWILQAVQVLSLLTWAVQSYMGVFRYSLQDQCDGGGGGGGGRGYVRGGVWEVDALDVNLLMNVLIPLVNLN